MGIWTFCLFILDFTPHFVKIQGYGCLKPPSFQIQMPKHFIIKTPIYVCVQVCVCKRECVFVHIHM